MKEYNNSFKVNEKSVFSSIEPMHHRTQLASQPLESGDQRRREPNVIMINLDIKPPHGGKHAKLKSTKSPSREPGLLARTEHVQPSTLPHTSSKIQNLSANITGARLPYQRHGKLNEIIFGDANSQIQRAPPPGIEYTNTKYLKNEAISSSHQTSMAGIKFMENAVLASQNQSRKNSTNGTNSFGDQNVAKSIKVDRAMLPEIADQHKSKEIITNGTRATSNHSKMQAAAAAVSDFSTSQQQNNDKGAK